MLKRLLIPPLIPTVLLVALSTTVIFEEVQIIDGRPDNAPRFAAVILVFLSPVFYIVFGVLNMIDARLDRFRSRAAWSGSIVLCCILSLLLTRVFYLPDVDSSAVPGIGIAILVGCLTLLPMTIIRRVALSPRREERTIRPQDAIAFGSLFPFAGDAPKIKKTEQGGASDGDSAPNQVRATSAPPDSL